MKIRRLLSHVLASAVMIAALGIPSVASSYVIPMVEQRLTTDGSSQDHPGISGSRIVYDDYRNGNNDIYLCDLSTGIEKRLTTDSAEQSLPEISGDKVVYQDLRNGEYDVYLYDLSTGAEQRLTTDANRQQNPRISGSRVVYQDNRNGNYDIYCYDLSTGVEQRITTDGSAQYSPSISGNRVVYADERNGNRDVYCYDLATGVEQQLTTDASTQWYPAISGAKVVYQDNRNGNYDIYCYDLSTGIEQRLTTDTGSQEYPAISGNRVVYNDNPNYDVYLYDLSTKIEQRLTTDDQVQAEPAISGDRVVYTDDRNGNYDIYLGELTVPKVGISAPVSVAYLGRATVSGTLASFGGIPLAGRDVVLETSVDGVSWGPVDAKMTDANGRFTLATPPLSSASWVRARFGGEVAYPSAESAAYLVKPKAYLSAPVAPWTMSLSRTYTVYGSLKPRHPSGSSAGRLYCYHYERGAWRLRRTLSLTAANYYSYSRYRASVRLPYAGRWRMRAYHSDAGHAPAYSAWRYATVR